MFNVSFIGTYVKRNSTLKLTRSVGRNQIFWIFFIKSVELVMCDSDFLVRDCNVCAKKRDKLYVGECMALTIGLRGMFGLCTFSNPFSLGGRGFVGFNVAFLH